MAPPPASRASYCEADIQLALAALNSNQVAHVTTAAATFNVPETTLRRRRAGKPSRRDCQPNSRKLMKLEEEVIVEYILELDSRGFSPTYTVIRDMANLLLS
jgi:hypothetical protein